jgi:hypothetical protein
VQAADESDRKRGKNFQYHEGKNTKDGIQNTEENRSAGNIIKNSKEGRPSARVLTNALKH